ncbi:MAG TPA: GNAT family N-acetyltransferase [Tepidisphaeraceae bacterium]|nr:GNAT family N-acetyltransferase [Tepidisphaeraceae bacterium]
MQITLATNDAAIAACFPVMSQLRPHLDANTFVARVRVQQAEGYHLAALCDGGGVVCVAGFRLMHMLVSGRTLYVDDLVTDAAARSGGHGEAMLRWLIARAREGGCGTFALDSGVQRHGAHRFYLRHRMDITAHHFTLKL